MTGRHYRRSDREDGFTVASCPEDEVICQPLVNAGAHYHKNEFAMMVLDGAIPAGAIVRHWDFKFLVYDNALFLLDCEGYVMSCRPSMTPYQRNAYEGRWR